MFVVAALYKFVSLTDLPNWQENLRVLCEKVGVKGTLLVAEEGLNGTIAGSREGIDAVLTGLRAHPEFADLEHKESFAETNPFIKLKVKIKAEIVPLGVPGIDPNRLTGTYVDPENWNALISSSDVLVLDTRNDYEVAIGTFEKAVDPKTHAFRNFPDFVEKNLDPSKQKKVAMFCTGGIRCEKASAFLLSKGFSEVFHLKGGILKYLEKVPEEKSLWNGECFVFDKRVAVDHKLQKGEYEFCPGCRGPVSAQDRTSPKYISDLCCPNCHDRLTEDQKTRFAERKKQLHLARERGLSQNWRTQNK